MSNAPRGRGPSFKHNILSDPPPSPPPGPSTRLEIPTRRKKSGDPAGHRIECTKPGRTRSNTGKKYLRPEDRAVILKDDPTCFLINEVSNIVHCAACGEDKELESKGYPLTGWLNHSRSGKHRSNARKHLSDARYAHWREWFEEHVSKRLPKTARSASVASSTASAPSLSTPPGIAFPVALPDPSTDAPPEWPMPTVRHHSLLSGLRGYNHEHVDHYESPSLASFRLRPAHWFDDLESMPYPATRDMSISRSL
ncbi:hypothetical protein FA13DRAFT_1731862 [Coprinellus micaceus]|uniref:Uncharacterized protein n=1 Tax=Coprinellus micaceus TaxID=71717 RepID=A0A4Y7TD74_COPMI|nr:hypothetical protein FA13DRAFT_1731862 [Coprinellus micaceus]